MLASSTAPLLDVVSQSQPNFPRIIFTFIPLFAILNTGLLNFVTASRLLYGMSREGLIPSWFGKLHVRRATPHRTILVILPIAIFLALFGKLQFLAGVTATLLLAMFFLVNLSLLIIKRREPRTSGFQVPLVIPALALVFNLALVAFASNDSRIFALVCTGIGIVLIGIRQVFTKKSLSNF